MDVQLNSLKFDSNGLIPAIIQDHKTHEVLMMAWMNRDAVRASLVEGRVCYWSRSRGKLWRKGETSGQTQQLHELRLDCDEVAIRGRVDLNRADLGRRRDDAPGPGKAPRVRLYRTAASGPGVDLRVRKHDARELDGSSRHHAAYLQIR